MPEPLSLNSPFLADVQRIGFDRPIPSLGKAWVMLAEALQDLRHQLDAPADQRNTLRARHELTVIAAIAWRSAVDVGVETREGAITQDIPF